MVHLYKTIIHLVFFSYFKILDVIPLVRVSEFRLKGYRQKKSFGSIEGDVLSSRHGAQRTAEIGWHLDKNIL